MPFNIFIFKVEILLYILIGLGSILLSFQYWLNKPRKTPKMKTKSEKPVIWYRIKK